MTSPQGLLGLLLSTTLMTSIAAQPTPVPEPNPSEQTGQAADPLIVNSADYFDAAYADYEPYSAYNVVGDEAEADVNAAGTDCEFTEDSNGIPACIAAIASRRACAGGIAFGFSIDLSTSTSAARNAAVREQIAGFISSTSEAADPNPNIYYAVQISGELLNFIPLFGTSRFATNTDQRLANSVRALQPDPTSELSLTANRLAGFDDLFIEFRRLADGHAPIYSAIAFIIIDEPFDTAPANVARRIADLQNSTLASLGVPVTTVAIGIGPTVIQSELELLASRPDLAFRARFYNTFAPYLSIAALKIDTDGDGANDCDDGCPTDPAKVTPGNCIPPASTPCAGSFAFLVDASGSLSESDFVDVMNQIASFIDVSSNLSTGGAANANEYYVASYTTSIVERTNTLAANAFGGVSQQAASFSSVNDGSKDTALALNDMLERFVSQRAGLPTDARFAFVITDGLGDSLQAVTQAADRLRGEGVVVIAFGPDGIFNGPVVRAIGTDQSGNQRVVMVSNYGALAAEFWGSLAAIDSDGDGANDCADSCPLDAAKVLAGACGCGITEPPPGGCCT